MERRAILKMMGAAAVVPFVTESAVLAADDAGMVFELRTYTCHEGKLEALLERFRKYEVAIFARVGMPGVAFWTPTDDPAKGKTLVYMLRHQSRESAKVTWAKFSSDPEWLKVKAESEKDGVLVDKHESEFLALTDFSPKI